jgi:cytochrome c-type biogenesis protein CcmE
MKKGHIILLILVVVGISAIASTFVDFSTYETFSSAAAKPGKKFQVYGFVQKDMDMKYDPVQDPNHFLFFAKDKAGNVKQVILNDAKPRDIEKSEWIVMTGYEENGVFHCSRVNMKCPSKYKKEMVSAGKG